MTVIAMMAGDACQGTIKVAYDQNSNGGVKALCRYAILL
jgi:hypothetical protein